MTKKLFHSTACVLCGSSERKDYQVIYPANYDVKNVASLFSARRLPDGIHSQIVKCKKDGQVRSNPVLNDGTLNQLYKESEFTYQHEVRNLVTTYIRAISHVLPKLQKNDRILEIGCGSGFVLSELKRRGYRKVSGVEPSKLAIEAADKSVQKEIVQKPFSSSLFPKNTFKLIFILQTLDHIPEPNEFLKGCFTQLEKGGYILSYHHNVESWSAKMMGEKSPIFDIEHTYLYSHQTSKALFEKAGFEVVKVFSPLNTLSLYHLLWLTPLPRTLKKIFLENTQLKNALGSFTLQVPLGNTCIIARKPL